MSTKILNLNNQAIPVDTNPRYITEIVDWIDGLYVQGFSIKKDRGIKIITAQINIEPVTFSFFFSFIFKVSTPPIT